MIELEDIVCVLYDSKILRNLVWNVDQDVSSVYEWNEILETTRAQLQVYTALLNPKFT